MRRTSLDNMWRPWDNYSDNLTGNNYSNNVAQCNDNGEPASANIEDGREIVQEKSSFKRVDKRTQKIACYVHDYTHKNPSRKARGNCRNSKGG